MTEQEEASQDPRIDLIQCSLYTHQTALSRRWSTSRLPPQPAERYARG